MEPHLLLFTGKGGVGKSTVAAATAVHYAEAGLRTILVSSDPAHSTDDVVDYQIGLARKRITPNFWVENIDTTTEAAAFVERLNVYLADTFGSTISDFDPEMISETAMFPGMDEYFALEKILGLIEGREVDEKGQPFEVVVFDTAPTGHTLRALATPEHIKRFMIRIMRFRRFISNLKGGFLFKKKEDPIQQALDDICERSDRFMTHLRNSDRVGLYLVSIASEAGFQECYRTISWMTRTLKVPVQGLVINHIIPDVGADDWALASENAAVALLRAEFEVQQPYLTRYQQVSVESGVPLIGISRLPYEPKGLDRLQSVADLLWRPEDGLKAPAGLKIPVAPPESG